jgi:tellurium resistance protein TerD
MSNIVLDLKKSANEGIVLDLRKISPSLKHLQAHMTWDMHPVYGQNLKEGFDLDLFALTLTPKGEVSGPESICYYGNQKLADGSVYSGGDNRTGGDDGEDMYFDLDKVAADKSQIDLFVTVFEYAERKQNFGMMANSKVELRDVDNDTPIVTYTLNDAFSNDTALHVGSFVREGEGWNFKPVGLGATADFNQILKNYA